MFLSDDLNNNNCHLYFNGIELSSNTSQALINIYNDDNNEERVNSCASVVEQIFNDSDEELTRLFLGTNPNRAASDSGDFSSAALLRSFTGGGFNW